MFKFFRNLKIGPRLAIGYGLIIALLMIVITLALSSLTQIARLTDDITGRAWDSKAGVERIIGLSSDNIRTTLAMILVNDPEVQASMVEQIKKTRGEISASYEKLEPLIVSDKGKALLAEAKLLRKAYVDTFNKANDSLSRGNLKEATAVMQRETLLAYPPYIAKLRELAELAKQEVETNGTALTEIAFFQRRVSLAVAVLALSLGSLFAFLITRQVTRATRRLSAVVQSVAEGDHNARVNLDTGDELGKLGRAFDSMLNERVASLTQKEKDSEAVNGSFIEMMRAVSKLSRGDLTVKAPVREDITGALADAINTMSESTARTLAGVAGVSQEVRSASQQGRDTVLSTAKGMNEIRGTIQETGKRIKRLGERSQEITGIVKLIDDIAERTSVLALNANMQAAMAGEAGRGFRVVADEVQRLAERSKEATDQISKLVTNIQSETNDTMATMDRAIGEVVKGGELAEKAAAQVTHLDELGGTLLDSVQAFTLPEEFLKEGQVAARRETGRRAA